MSIKIMIADDHRLVREGLKQLLETESEFKVIGEANNGIECIDIYNELKPDVLLLDINMPVMNGLDALKVLKQENEECKIIILTINEEIDYLIKCLEYNCDGYILKDSDFQTLREAIISVCDGNIFIQQSLLAFLNSNLAKRDMELDKLAELTNREEEILKMIARGFLNKEIAATLNISERTVKNHVSNIFKKLDVSDRTQAAVFAIKNNLVNIK